MSQDSDHRGPEEMTRWAREKLDEAVAELMQRGVVTDVVIEARPVWALPNNIMIGQVRDANKTASFKWVIAGDVPIDHADSVVASNPREAVRHFAMKWQLDAARYQDPSVQNALGPDHRESWDRLGRSLIDKAEALFALADNESLWQ